MTTPKEFGKVIPISIGAIVFIIAVTFWVTTFYHNLNTLESRVDKKYNRLEKRIEKLEDECN